MLTFAELLSELSSFACDLSVEYSNRPTESRILQINSPQQMFDKIRNILMVILTSDWKNPTVEKYKSAEKWESVSFISPRNNALCVLK